MNRIPRLSQTFAASAIASACVLLFLSGCKRESHEQDAAAVTPVAPVASVVRAPLATSFHAAGVFVPFQEVELHAKVAGYIRHIHVDIGDRVRQGEVLATLDVPELNAQVTGAEAGVRQSKEQITRARSEVLRAQADYDAVKTAAERLQQVSSAKPGLIAQQELDNALAKERAGAAQVDAAKAAQSAMQQQLGVSQASHQQVSAMADYSRITAPFSGIVTWRYADTGALIQAGTSNSGSAPVVKIAQVDTLRLRLPVPASLAPFVHVGDLAQVRVDALNRTFSGSVTRSTGALDAATRSMQVEIDLPNRDGSLSPGMYADVSLNIQRTGDALVVPIQAVDQSGAQPFVLLVNSANKIEKRAVRTGVATANRIEILSGVQQGNRVIVANLSSFTPDETVIPKQSSIGEMQQNDTEGR